MISVTLIVVLITILINIFVKINIDNDLDFKLFLIDNKASHILENIEFQDKREKSLSIEINPELKYIKRYFIVTY